MVYRVQTFQSGFGKHKSIYQPPPSPEVDDAWNELYNGDVSTRNLPIEELTLSLDCGISSIPKAQAEKLPNKTYPFAEDEGYYIASLSVFYQLHYLALRRRAVPVAHVLGRHQRHGLAAVQRNRAYPRAHGRSTRVPRL